MKKVTQAEIDSLTHCVDAAERMVYRSPGNSTIKAARRVIAKLEYDRAQEHRPKTSSVRSRPGSIKDYLGIEDEHSSLGSDLR